MTAEEYQSYVEGLPFSFSLFALRVFFSQPWMTKTGKQIGEVSTAWFCQLKELGFCSKPSFVLCASSLNDCSWVLSRDLEDPCGLRRGWSTLMCEWCTCVLDACSACSDRHTHVLLMKNPSSGQKGPGKLMAPLSVSELPCCVML